jgi:hypothetical protein
MPKPLSPFLALLAVIGLIALAGCGGDESTTTAAETETEATAPSDEELSSTIEDALDDPDAGASGEYGTELSAILGEFTQTFQDEGAALQGATDPAQLASGIETLEGALQTTIDDLSALEVPEAAQAGHEEVVASFEDLSSKLADVGSAVDAEDQQAAQQAVIDLQSSVSGFLQQFSSGLQKIASSGVQIDPSAVSPAP